MSIGLTCGCCGATASERWKFTVELGWRCEACTKKCDPRTSCCMVK